MDRNDYTIPIHCLVCEHYQAILKDTPLRQAGVAPALTDEEMMYLHCQLNPN